MSLIPAPGHEDFASYLRTALNILPFFEKRFFPRIYDPIPDRQGDFYFTVRVVMEYDDLNEAVLGPRGTRESMHVGFAALLLANVANVPYAQEGYCNTSSALIRLLSQPNGTGHDGVRRLRDLQASNKASDVSLFDNIICPIAGQLYHFHNANGALATRESILSLDIPAFQQQLLQVLRNGGLWSDAGFRPRNNHSTANEVAHRIMLPYAHLACRLVPGFKEQMLEGHRSPVNANMLAPGELTEQMITHPRQSFSWLHADSDDI